MTNIFVKTIKNNILSIIFTFKRFYFKKLVIVRHGKSSWKYNASDIDRPLKQLGIAYDISIFEEFF